jgi:glycosyltransferase involved in cell wall biosynthesis
MKIPKTKVGMLTTGHSALDDRIFYKESMSLQRAGYEVTLLAPVNDEGFLVDMGSNNLVAGELTIQNIKIIGFAEKGSRFNKIHAILQLITLVSMGNFKLGTEPFANLIDKGTKLRADIYHCHEIWSIYAGIQIKKRLEKEGKKPKLIYDVHEYSPAVGSSSNMVYRLYSRILRKIIVHFEKEALGYVDYVITANLITRGYLLTLNRFIQTEVIYNCPVLSIFQETGSNKAYHKNKIIICHEGSLGFDRGLKLMIEVMRILKKRYDDKIELLIVGDVFGEERKYLKEKIEGYGLRDAVWCTGWLPYEKVGEAISQADIGIIFMEPTENNMLAGPPNKLFNYMRYGLPVISVDLPETSRIIKETQCGLVVKDRSVNSLARALSALIEDEDKRHQLGENAKKAVYNQYSWEQMEKRLLRVYEEWDLIKN